MKDPSLPLSPSPPLASVSLGKPKSKTLTMPSRRAITFSGLMSQRVILRKRSGQDLDGDFTVEPRVARAVDLAHSARAKGAQNLIVRNGS